jgi:DNA modification methylase
LAGDCRHVLRGLEDSSVHCVVTSPPYWGLRDYGTAQWEGGDPGCNHINGRPGSDRADGIVAMVSHRNRDGAGAFTGDCRKCGARRIDSQIGLEATPSEYVEVMVGVFREVWRVLRADGTAWINLGDSYHNGDKGGYAKDRITATDSLQRSNLANNFIGAPNRQPQAGLKPKDLIGMPWRVAFALQADGWYLRQDIIWSKPNPMPESVRDRCTKAHEYIFMLSKSERYYYDQDAIREPLAESSIGRIQQENFDNQTGGPKDYGHRTNANRSARKALCNLKEKYIAAEKWGDRYAGWEARDKTIGRNKRSVWEVATAPFSQAHFATFPPALIEPCILAGCPKGGTVLDPFAGAGTTGLVADRLSRNAILVELNADYADMARRRIADDAGMFAQIAD